MATFNHANFAERQSTSAKAKAALLDKMRSRPAADDPATLAKHAERRALHEAREKRLAEREAARLDQERREAAERAVIEAAEAAAAAERERQLAAERVIAEARQAIIDAEREAVEAQRAMSDRARLQRASRIIAEAASFKSRKAAR